MINRHYAEMAEKNLPPLHHETVKSDKKVKIVPDGSFLGFKALPDGKIPDVVVMQNPRKLNDGMVIYDGGTSFVIDFGRHCVGRLSFMVDDDGKYLDAPVKLRLRFAETPYELGRDWSTYHGTLCSSWLQEEIVNIDNKGLYKLPRRYAFRYLEVNLVATYRPTKLYDFTVECETSADVTKMKPLPDGTDPVLVRIDEVAAATLRDCMQEAYEDGPKRDRRLWSGDLRLQALTDQVLFDNRELARRSMYLFAACEEDGRYLPGCLYMKPEIYSDRDISIADYSMAFCRSVADYYCHTGDAETVRDLFPVVKRQIELHISDFNSDGSLTLSDDWKGFIDWAKGLKKNAAVTGFFLYAVDAMIPVAREIGEDECADRWSAFADETRAKAKKYYFDTAKNVFVCEGQLSVQSQVWMILGGVTSGEEGRTALETALADPESVKQVTPYMNYYLVEAFMKLGMKDEAKAHIIGYWGKMVDEGADTFWEVFKPDDRELSPYSDPVMHSFCHAWSCAPSYFIRKYLV
ncbi:MAG: glycoside hydrolase [Firmicutes bacterium]|nr:glycoside hydrolase [Candidatus Colimorpha enterica]